jgi:hypothetical protein
MSNTTNILEGISTPTLAAWLRAASKEAAKQSLALNATLDARDALRAELARRNREKVGIPPIRPNCGSCQHWNQHGTKAWGDCPHAEQHGLFGGSRRTEVCPEHQPFPELDSQWVEVVLDDPRQ